MLLLIGVLLSAVVILTLLHARSSQGAHGAHLGWMSEQWLAEYRASHPS